MKIGVLGADGNLGTAFSKLFSDKIDLFSHCKLDITHYMMYDSLLSSYDVIINCAAWTEVDKAELFPAEAKKLNTEAPIRLAEFCKKRGALFVTFSTDYVFDGNKNSPYVEEDSTNPLNVYGKTKLDGEIGIREVGGDALIIRTSWLFGNGKNFVNTLKNKYVQGTRVFEIVDDQIGCPTFSEDLARISFLAINKGLRGIYHISNFGQTSWFEFSQKIFSQLNILKDVKVIPINSSKLNLLAKRPHFSVLSTEKIVNVLGIDIPSYEDALARFLGRTNA